MIDNGNETWKALSVLIWATEIEKNNTEKGVESGQKISISSKQKDNKWDI